MLENLKELSKVLLIPAAILYFFGFICITAYLARFGIISFDIVSSRFIIAGFYPFVWELYTYLTQPKFYGRLAP